METVKSYKDILMGHGVLVALDLAERHTGVAIWDGTELKTWGFKASYDAADVYGYEKLRRDVMGHLRGLLGGLNCEAVEVEDIYGGCNFHTVRVLSTLNTVPDSMLIDGVFHTDCFLRLRESEWLSGLRGYMKLGKKLQVKYECEAILKQLGFELEADEAFREDRLDAAGQLLGMVYLLNKGLLGQRGKSAEPKVSMSYVPIGTDLSKLRFVKGLDIVPIVYTGGMLRNFVQGVVPKMEGGTAVVAEVPTGALGAWGKSKGLKFYVEGKGLFILKLS